MKKNFKDEQQQSQAQPKMMKKPTRHEKVQKKSKWRQFIERYVSF